MPSIDPISGFTSSATTSTSQNELGQDAFLRLLTTQLEYQDPLNPQSDTEFIAQLAQFSSLEQLREANENLDTLELYQVSINNSNALNLVGKQVNIVDGFLSHQQGRNHTVNFDIPSGAETIKIMVRDEENKIVRVVELDGRTAGATTFQWDGLDDEGIAVPDGDYSIEIEASDIDGNTIALSPYQRRKVDGLAYENGAIYLMVGDRKLPIEGVNEVYDGNTKSPLIGTSNILPAALIGSAYGRY
jgi:flagellar basal-body rod modification protein FlgD